MWNRFKVTLKAWLVGLDCALTALLMAPKFIAVGGEVPNGRQTLSGRIGRAADHGRRWGEILEKPIDWFWMKLGSAPLHCRRTYHFERSRGISN